MKDSDSSGQASGSGTDPRRALVSVSSLLDEPDVQTLILRFSRPAVMEAIGGVLDQVRSRLKSGDETPGIADILDQVREVLLPSERERLRPVINGTGILLHTGLGRAVLPRDAVRALADMDRCCNLQVDLNTGERGKRNFTTEYLLTRLTGAEAALVVTNNAAATLLLLTVFCQDREVIVSRGQLVEIGGSFRLPDCIRQSGARLVEVGTTNKTHLRDYSAALSEDTGAILRVNPSNYRIIGFSKEVPVADLAGLKKDRDVLVIDDLGCGALIDLRTYGLPYEPTVPESVAAGADLVCFSGDKLIGGPQAGIIVGRETLIRKIKKHPLTRMLRVGKLTDLALEHTLRLFLDPDTLCRKHPTLNMLTRDAAALRRKALRIKRNVDRQESDLEIRVIDGESFMGGGSLPGVPIPTALLSITSPTRSADNLCRALRTYEPPIIARISNHAVNIDFRTLLDGEERVVQEALIHLGAGR